MPVIGSSISEICKYNSFINGFLDIKQEIIKRCYAPTGIRDRKKRVRFDQGGINKNLQSNINYFPLEDDKLSVRSFRSEKILKKFNHNNNGKSSPRMISTPTNRSIISRDHEDLAGHNSHMSLSNEKNDSFINRLAVANQPSSLLLVRGEIDKTRDDSLTLSEQ